MREGGGLGKGGRAEEGYLLICAEKGRMNRKGSISPSSSAPADTPNDNDDEDKDDDIDGGLSISERGLGQGACRG